MVIASTTMLFWYRIMLFDISINYGRSRRHFMPVLAGEKQNYYSARRWRMVQNPCLNVSPCQSFVRRHVCIIDAKLLERSVATFIEVSWKSLSLDVIKTLARYDYNWKLSVKNYGKSKLILLKNTLLLKSVIKHLIIIKIIYLSLVKKDTKREHIICFAALCRSTYT
jgi:hypothetical protein